MGNGLPLDAVRAEVESWPLASPEAFRRALTRLVLGDSGVLTGETRDLWRELEDLLRLRAGRVSLAELTPIRDDAWFSVERDGCRSMQIGALPLHVYLRRLAASVLTLERGVAKLRDASRGPSEYPNADGNRDANRVDNNRDADHDHQRSAADGGRNAHQHRADCDPPRGNDEAPSRGAAGQDPTVEAVERWRWLSIYLPPDLLLAATAAEVNVLEVPEHVELMPTELAAHFSRQPVAQQHLHIGAGPSVTTLWDELTRETSFPKRLDGELPMVDFTQHLLAAGNARRVLTEHVERRAENATASLSDTLCWFAEECARRRGRTTYDWRRDSHRLLRVLLEPGTAPEPLHWMSRARARLPPPSRKELSHRELLRRCFVALSATGDRQLESVFMQYLRVYTRTYRHLVQDPSSCGLDWFTRHFVRIRPLTHKAVKRRRLIHTILHDGAGLQLDSLEIRTRPEPAWQEIGGEVRGYIEQMRGRREAEPCEWGITFHLIKDHEVKVTSRRMHRVGDVGPGGRYGRWFRARRREVRALEYLIRRRPQLLEVIRGIDVANVELAVPTWIVAPLLTRVREVSQEIARRTTPMLTGLTIVPHLGEDYRRLSEGLRRISEALSIGILQDQGRVGHGLALGTCSAQWADYHPQVYQPREERLFDLLWEHELADRRIIVRTAERRCEVDGEIDHHAEALFAGERVPRHELLASYTALVDPVGVDRQFGYGRIEAGRDAPTRLAERWLFDRGVFLRGLQPVSVRATPSEVAVLQQAQAYLADEFRRRRITIECNPSSNLLVGGLSRLVEHPMFRFLPREDPMAPWVPISLNSDDPISFATRLADEYAYTYWALVAAGTTPDAALVWLEQARQNGWSSKITRSQSRDQHVLAKLVPGLRR